MFDDMTPCHKLYAESGEKVLYLDHDHGMEAGFLAGSCSIKEISPVASVNVGESDSDPAKGAHPQPLI